MVDVNSDGACEGEVPSVFRRGPGSQLFDTGDKTGHRVVEVLVLPIRLLQKISTKPSGEPASERLQI